MRFILPIILILASIGLFVAYIDPQYQQVKALSAQAAEYDDALTKAKELRTTRDQLLSKRNTFSQDDLTRIGRALPDNVDNIRLIIDINNIASRHALSLKSISAAQVSDSSQTRSALAVGNSGDPLGSVTVNFVVGADYDTFLTFLHDLEHSLRIVDVENIEFASPSQGTATDYTVSLRTYWLH